MEVRADSKYSYKRGRKCIYKRHIYSLNDDAYYDSLITIIGKAQEGWSKPDIVSLKYQGKTLIGYCKSTKKHGDKNYIEVLLTKIGKTLGVPMADIIVVLTDEKIRKMSDIVSISVVQNCSETFVSFREMRDELYYDFQNGSVLLTPWLKRWIEIRDRKRTLPANIGEVNAVCIQDY